MSRYRLTDEAERDLDGIGSWIARDDPGAAMRVIDAIEVKCQALADMPGKGRAREELGPGSEARSRANTSSSSGRTTWAFRSSA